MFTQNSLYKEDLPIPNALEQPVTVINLTFSGNMPSLVLGKVIKFQHPSSSHFTDNLEKPEGWMKTPPPPDTNGVKEPTKPNAVSTETFDQKQIESLYFLL